MVKNYFVTAINNLVKNKLYSTINIVGLAIGLATCIVIALYVKDESSYDKQWKNADSLYRMHYSFNVPGGDSVKFSKTPGLVRAALEAFFPEEIERSARTISMRANELVQIGDVEFEELLVYVDSAFIDMFEFEVLSGSLQTTLTDPSNIALSEAVAIRFFGSQDAVGQVLTINDLEVNKDYQVSAVYSVPGNTVLDVPMLSLLDESALSDTLSLWSIVPTPTYIQLKPGVDIKSVENRLPALIDQTVDLSQFMRVASTVSASEVILTGFQNIKTLHLDSPWDTSRAGGDLTMVLAFSIISVLVLIIGGINFIILTTAKATQRAREVAMRKVLGAKRKQLIFQFLGESFFIVMLAMALSLALVEIILPIFETLVGKELAVDYSTPTTFLYLLTLLLLVGTVGGLYPAFILSNFRPASTLKSNRSAETKGSSSLRNILVVFQFSVSIVLMIATSVIFMQLQYSTNRDPGFNKENLLVINTLGGRPELQEKVELLKQELLSLASVSSVGLSNAQPSTPYPSYQSYLLLGQSNPYTLAQSPIGYDYFQTYQIPLVAGRYYDLERDTPAPGFNSTAEAPNDSAQELLEHNIMANVSATRALGFSSAEEAVGKVLNASNVNYTIIGVVADNHIFSINALPRAEMYPLNRDFPNIVTLRFQGSTQEIVEQVNSVWTNVMGEVEISAVFVDQLLAEEFSQEQIEARMLISFSLLAMMIACLGLFGSAAFTVDRRTKEIGLRKVMGGKVKQIVQLLLWQFSKPVLLANILAWPVAVWVMVSWLESFPYHIAIWLLIPFCFAAGFIALAIAWITVASSTARVAQTNPIYALRYE